MGIGILKLIRQSLTWWLFFSLEISNSETAIDVGEDPNQATRRDTVQLKWWKCDKSTMLCSNQSTILYSQSVGSPWYWENNSISEMPKFVPSIQVDCSFDFLAYCNHLGYWFLLVYWRLDWLLFVWHWLLVLSRHFYQCPLWYSWFRIASARPYICGFDTPMRCIWILNRHIILEWSESPKIKILRLLSFPTTFF